ncbi:MAG TPA: GMC family oxidoreductase [Candidatus Angelobacter sp.]|nr:GMC family oxidoreductase [Candidatus Angelobacter sp.]
MEGNIVAPEFDVIFVGSGIAAAMAAHRLARARFRVLMLEAGGVVPDSLNRLALLRNYIASPGKTPDSPYCGDELDPEIQPDQLTGKNYYQYPDGNKHIFKSFYEKLVGGSTWHWQGIWIRMLPSDFEMNRLYGVGQDWPKECRYNTLEHWYAEAEQEVGVAGNDQQAERYMERKFGAYRSTPFPMPELTPSYLDAHVAAAVQGKVFTDSTGRPENEILVTNVPHAINSQLYDGRPACDGRTSCVPLCASKARYDAVAHIEKALAAGAELRANCTVTRINLDPGNGRMVTGVDYIEKNGTNMEKYTVTGHIVVVAANGMETPRLLLNSNVANSSNLVGCNLMDHPIKQSFALTVEPVFPFRGPQTTSDIEAFRDGAFRRQYAAYKTSIKNDGWSTVAAVLSPRGTDTDNPNVMNRENPPKHTDDSMGTLLNFVGKQGLFGSKLKHKVVNHLTRQIVLNSAAEQLPNRDNRVVLSKTKNDKFGVPLPEIHYALDNDQGYLQRCFDNIIKFHEFVFDQMHIPAKDQYLQNDGFNTYGGSGHIMGTTVMGEKKESSVVDHECKAHDHDNLFILGSSVFPTSSTANPTSTIAALSLRAVDAIGTAVKVQRAKALKEA